MIITTSALAHFNERPEGAVIDTIILHSMYCPFPPEKDSALQADVCINWLRECEVSSHYIISQQGEVYQLVEPKERAWHAGKSQMPDGRENVNDFSIGIELISPAEGSYPDVQIASLQQLISGLKKSFPIKFILGHKDVATNRKNPIGTQQSKADYLVNSKNEPKTDPWSFPWDKLANLL